jgi:dynein heavy chain
MSPATDAFRNRLRQFPALVNCCTIDWFAPWPEAALRSVAQYFLGEAKIDALEVSEWAMEEGVRV